MSANLLTNGGFESSLGGWLASGGSPTASTYGDPGSIATTAPGPPSRGTRYLSGGDQQTSTLEQVVSVAAYSSDIDSAKAQLEVSGWFGGNANETDWARVTVHYLNSLDQVIDVGEHYVLGAGRVERNGMTALLRSVERFPIPVGTQKVHLVVELKRTTIDGLNDAYVDELSLRMVNIATADAPPPIPTGSSPELVRNGKFDAAAGGTGNIVRAPSWPSGIAVKYNTPDWPNTTADAVPTDHGPNFWAGNPAPETSTSQKTSVSSWSSVLDKGKTVAQLSAYIGKYLTDADFAQVRLAFLNGAGTILTSVELTGPGQFDSLGRTGLWYVATTAMVPPGTRSVSIRLKCLRNSGTACDGYLDDVSARLLNVPPAPKVTSVSPSPIAHGAITRVTINGSGFRSGAKVSVSGNAISVSNVDFISATRLKATITVGNDAATTKRTVTVTNPSTVKGSCTCLKIS